MVFMFIKFMPDEVKTEEPGQTTYLNAIATCCAKPVEIVWVPCTSPERVGVTCSHITSHLQAYICY